VAFLGFVREDRLYALWWLIALRGLRRSEAAGLRWVDLDLDRKVLLIDQQRLAYGHVVADGPPKTAASRRAAALDRVTVKVLREHARRQKAERAAAGAAWQDCGYVFTAPDGAPLHPGHLTRRFRRLTVDSALPPVRLHDLRHGAASLAHSAGADLKTVQEQLGHTSIVVTADTYTSVLLDHHFKAAEATARLVLAAAARNPALPNRRRGRTGPPASAAPEPPTRLQPARPRRNRPGKRAHPRAHPRDTHMTPKLRGTQAIKHNRRPERVRRQGLEPRTRGLRAATRRNWYIDPTVRSIPRCRASLRKRMPWRGKMSA
jgi:hypothetical protein